VKVPHEFGPSVAPPPSDRQPQSAEELFTDVVLGSLAHNTASIGTGVILLLAAQAMKRGTFSVGSLALFVAYLDEITSFTTQFSQNLALYKQATVSLQRLQGWDYFPGKLVPFFGMVNTFLILINSLFRRRVPIPLRSHVFVARRSKTTCSWGIPRSNTA